MKHKLDNIFVWFYYLHIKYLSRHEDAQPFFEARFSLAVSLTIILENIIHLVCTKFCFIYSRWVGVVLFLLIFYITDKHYRIEGHEHKIIKNLDLSFAKRYYSKSFGLFYFIFMLLFTVMSIYLGKVFYDQCFFR